ncbi:mannosyltransferase complex subunit Alg2 [Schizosaccharomyces japonicus yFS275]|uniref:Alpha-1,3/1,6-mannosyltransferase ALG2 n=1 Tax=Schizosaccharomyces japonicus (strain yFS275 / FY16936) TaxID=402676 RepID=B6K374_SCHJY|nr:mannosyltransferase complex subunit Alg2 [Schizosaccharomyces japonicus yFS275]EEB07931.1 mannosyltransferase complex subunit Alg2 [Schizosaccharomyces japonicus yFS275]
MPSLVNRTKADSLAPNGVKRIAFIHPDLGIGGAERLVVDSALGLKALGNDVVIYSSHCDMNHCFEEIRDGTIAVRVYGDWLPVSIFGRMSILCSTLRQLYLTFVLLCTEKFDAIVVDQLSTCIPFLLLICKTLLFYCHFPDKYLAKPGGLLKKLYRIPFDWIEEESIRVADRIVVNSNFTASVFKKAFPRIKKPVRIIHPCVDTTGKCKNTFPLPQAILERNILISVNRFEKKKDINLAVESFAALRDFSTERFEKALLVVVGGYDVRVAENRNYLKELQTLCGKNSLKYQTIETDWLNIRFENDTNVLFLLSVPSDLRDTLIAHAKVLLYTPENEHFGIVPLEAMLRRVPVLAQTNGGPLETVRDGKTGWLRPRDPTIWSNVINEALLGSTYDLEAMGQTGKEWVEREFSVDVMSKKFESEILSGIRAMNDKRYIKRIVDGSTAIIVMLFVLWAAYVSVTEAGLYVSSYFFGSIFTPILGVKLGSAFLFIALTIMARCIISFKN